jgi:long-chain acyl-CoA synthetase
MNVPDLIARAARLHPDRAAVECGAETRTVADIDRRSSRFANALIGLGLGKGDRLVVLLENSARCIECDFASAKAGLVRVSLNPRTTPGEARYILGQVQPRAVVFGAGFDWLPPLLDELGPQTLRIGAQPGALALDPHAHDYEALLEQAIDTPPSIQIDDEDLHSIFFTSGSSGKPKGVMLSHRSIVQVAANVLIEFGPQRPGERILLLQPLSHGSAYFVLPCFMCACCIRLMPRFDAEAVVDAMRSPALQAVKLVPTMLQRLLAVPRVGAHGYPGLRHIIYGGSHIAPAVLERAIDAFGPRLAQHYGQSEAPSTITVLPREDHGAGNAGRAILRSAGRAWTTVDVRIAGPDGITLAAGVQGEVVVRAPHVMSGYWQRPELTTQVLKQGWLYTSDHGVLDERGYLHLLGRMDDMIISGGFNIAPLEVEDALLRHPMIREAAVVGRADEEWGHVVVAFVCVQPGTLTAQQIGDYCRERLGYRKPRHVYLVEDLPRNANGKIDKAALKAAAAARG